jgi:FAD/FMN-containing dehydrogenase
LITLSAVRVHISEEKIEIRLSVVEKALGLLGNISISCADVSDVQVLEDPLHEVMRAGLKVGLRLPWLYYVCRSIRLDRAWAVRRGVPALSFAVRNQGALEQVTVSTPDAHAFADRLRR